MISATRAPVQRSDCGISIAGFFDGKPDMAHLIDVRSVQKAECADHNQKIDYDLSRGLFQ
jgi:hypothetical protein